MDVGAKEDVVRIVRALRDQGIAIVVFSTEPETVLSLADRVLVMRKGEIAHEFAGEAISDFQSLRHLAPVTGPVPSTPTVWRALNEAGDLQLARINAAVTGFRRHWWGLLAGRPEGFPWLRVDGRELTGITVVDLDASIVFAASPADLQGRDRVLPESGYL